LFVREPGISRIGVIGAGSWGTTLANLLAEKGFEVDLWLREQEVLDRIKMNM
jgi:glycerol-3-phosphate dehydrogenase (NAD(P)+)